ncbi:MAG: carbamate kinase, partial [Clostridia bacterium]
LGAGQVVVAAGGGGIPVIAEGHHLRGVSAVIDKDFAACKLAEMLEADFLVILTAVEKVAIRFGKPDQEWLSDLTVEQAQKYCDEGHFAPGSMLPKVQAAMAFVKSGSGRTALITKLQMARDGIEGKTGTRIH